MLKKRTFFLLGGLIVLIYLLILQRYGTAIPAPIPPEEINFAGLARNIAEGKGPIFAIPSELVPNPTLNPRRVYTPVLSYAFALSGWGKIWGFDLLPLRWFNRILGALNLLLLIGLARRWGVPRGLALLAAFWTAMDILFQLNGNIVRSDMFSLLWTLLGLLAFTHAQETQQAKWSFVSGTCFTIAVFAHTFETLFLFLGIVGLFFLQRRWKETIAFLIPSALAGLGWLFYALQDWQWFLKTLQMAAQDRTPKDWLVTLASLLGVPSLVPILGIYPINSPLWFGMLLVLTWAKWRKHLYLPWWQIGVLWIAYLTAYINPYLYYEGWFSPLGYLAAALWSQVLIPRRKGRELVILILLACLWSGYQAVQVGKCWQAAPAIHQAHQAFFQELAEELPAHSTFWLLALPDPYTFLHQARPDLTLYVGSGYFPVSEEFIKDLDGAILTLRDAPPLSSYPIHREWVLPGVIKDYSIIWVGDN